MRFACLLIFCMLTAVGCQPDRPSPASQSMGVEYSPSEEALREIVGVIELSIGRLQAFADIDQGTSADMYRLQVQLAEARLALVAVTGDQEGIVANLRVIVERWERHVQEQRLRQDIGQGNVIETNEAEIQLIRARDRLRQVEERISR